ncbi:MAG: YheT family hydrolase [Bryobacteraceae bacterium]
MAPFEPIVANPHLLTMAANFWPRKLDTSRFPVESTLYRTEPDVQVLVQSQRPAGAARGEIVMVHGLEGSGDSGYMVSLAQSGLDAGFRVSRFHMRTCGGTAHLCPTLYHAGLTSDLLWVLREYARAGRGPVHLVGFSLGGNVVLKLAGELDSGGGELLHSVCAVSTPIDLAACARKLGRIENRLYEWRFLRRMCARLVATGRYRPEDFRGIGSIWEIDDKITAPSFGMRGAEHYYGTMSSRLFLDRIRVPALVIQAKDDTFIPFEIFDHPAFRTNPRLRLEATERGGHVGFISRRRPRFWLDSRVLEWVTEVAANQIRISSVL